MEEFGALLGVLAVTGLVYAGIVFCLPDAGLPLTDWILNNF